MSSFAEILLDVGRDYSVSGGPEFHTVIVTTAAGLEQRNQTWEVARGRWQLGERHIQRAKKDALQAFFRARRGSLQGFRFRDWTDYEVAGESFYPAGARNVQLVKTYDDGSGFAYARPITKPRSGVTLTRAGNPEGYASLDTATGILTLAPDVEASVYYAYAEYPARLEFGLAHGFTTGQSIHLRGLYNTWGHLNDEVYPITVVDSTHITLDGIDGTGYTTEYESGAFAGLYPQPGETLTWSGEFDVPVRFEADEFRTEFVTSELFHLAPLAVVELKA